MENNTHQIIQPIDKETLALPWRVLIQMAKTTKDPTFLRTLVLNSNMHVVAAAAGNIHTPSELFWSETPVWNWKQWRWTLKYGGLANHDWYIVRDESIGNPAMKTEDITKASEMRFDVLNHNKEGSRFTEVMLSNPNTSTAVVDKFMEHSDKGIAAAAKANRLIRILDRNSDIDPAILDSVILLLSGSPYESDFYKTYAYEAKMEEGPTALLTFSLQELECMHPFENMIGYQLLSNKFNYRLLKFRPDIIDQNCEGCKNNAENAKLCPYYCGSIRMRNGRTH